MVRQNPKAKPAVLNRKVMKIVLEQPNPAFLRKLKRAANDKSKQSVDSDAVSIGYPVVVLSKLGDCAAVIKILGLEIKEIKKNSAKFDFELVLRELKKRGKEAGV